MQGWTRVRLKATSQQNTFAQQAIKTRACPQLVGDEKANFPIAHGKPGDDGYYRIGAALWELGTGVKGAMIFLCFPQSHVRDWNACPLSQLILHMPARRGFCPHTCSLSV